MLGCGEVLCVFAGFGRSWGRGLGDALPRLGSDVTWDRVEVLCGTLYQYLIPDSVHILTSYSSKCSAQASRRRCICSADF